MLKYCLKKWDAHKGELERVLRTSTKMNECDYVDLVKLVVKHILNNDDEKWTDAWDHERITVVDDGNYQGTQLFLIPRGRYQPCEFDYLMTFVDYGSCSGCDTLQGIQSYGNGVLTDRQVKDFMALCKDLVTNMIKPYNCGWRNEEEFEQVEMDGGVGNG